ncbi:MAG: hypothetical protein AAGH99_06445 [Planctomycetota bacterium]
MSLISPPNLDTLLQNPATAEAAVRPVGSDFASLLSVQGENESTEPTDAKAHNRELREAAEQLVASAFILPLLQQARNDPFKSDLFHGGRGEEAFGQQLDVIYADNITRSANFGITDALVSRFERTEPANPTEVDLRG